MEKKHCEKGRPEFSLWNRCANIKEDTYSGEARFCFNRIIQIISINVKSDSIYNQIESASKSHFS